MRKLNPHELYGNMCVTSITIYCELLLGEYTLQIDQ